MQISQTSDEDIDAFIAENEASLNNELAKSRLSYRRQLSLWAAKWVVGFMVVYAVVVYFNDFYWLWLATAFVAFGSLVWLVATNFLHTSKIEAARKKTAALREMDFGFSDS